MDLQVHQVEKEFNELPGGLTWYFIGQPKTQKTTQASQWSDRGQAGVLVIDTDLGADFVAGANVITATSLNAPMRNMMHEGKKVMKSGKEIVEMIPPTERGYYYRSGASKGQPMPVYSIAEIYQWLRAEWAKLPYDTLVVDTVDQVNQWIEQTVVEEMEIVAMGDGGWGSDWGRARKRNLDIIRRLQRFMKKSGSNLILVSHAKQSMQTDNKIQLMPELPRGLAYALCAKADVIGYITIDKADEKAHISFKSYDERTVGSRLRPLAQKKLPFSYEAIKNEIISYREEE